MSEGDSWYDDYIAETEEEFTDHAEGGTSQASEMMAVWGLPQAAGAVP